MTLEERTKIKDAIDTVNERLEDIRVEFDKATDDEEYAPANDLDCGPFVNYKYELGQERNRLRGQRDERRARLQG